MGQFFENHFTKVLLSALVVAIIAVIGALYHDAKLGNGIGDKTHYTTYYSSERTQSTLVKWKGKNAADKKKVFRYVQHDGITYHCKQVSANKAECGSLIAEFFYSSETRQFDVLKLQFPNGMVTYGLQNGHNVVK